METTTHQHPEPNTDERLPGSIRSRHSARSAHKSLEHGDPSTWHPEVWQWSVEALEVRSVLDVGCGEGHAAAHFRRLGCRIRAVDGSLEAHRDSLVPDAHVVHDFTRGAYFPGDDYDLAWCCGFVEHVEERHSANFLETFRAASRWLMMTHAVPGQQGQQGHHGDHPVNLQPAEYWIDRVEALGFRYHDVLTGVSRRVAGRGHYSGRGLLFARA